MDLAKFIFCPDKVSYWVRIAASVETVAGFDLQKNIVSSAKKKVIHSRTVSRNSNSRQRSILHSVITKRGENLRTKDEDIR